MRCLTLSLLLIWIIPAFCQEQASNDPLIFTHITEQNGLSDDHVNCVLRDDRGFMWIGTADGLNCIDGSAITIHRHRNNDNTSIGNNNILSLSMDANGRIWIGTIDGLSVYDPKRMNFRNFHPPPSSYGSSAIINAIIPENPHLIWLATDGGLIALDPETEKFTPYINTGTLSARSSIHANKITGMIRSVKGSLWMSTANGVWSFETSTRRFTSRISEKNDDHFEDLFLCVYEDPSGIIWAGNWQFGLKRLDPSTGRVSNFLHVPDHPGNVYSILQMQLPGNQKVLWLDGGLTGFNPATGKFFRFPRPLDARDWPNMAPCYTGPDGGIWLRSEQGLYYFDPGRQHFHHQFFPEPLTSQTIVFTEWEHQLLAGAQSTSFAKAWNIPWKERSDSTPNFNSGKGELRYAAALSFASPNEEELWAGSSEGIAVYDKRTRKTKWFRHDEHDSSSMPRNFISHLFFDSKNQLWIFPWREGIWQMDRNTGACQRLWEGFLQGPDHLKRLVIADAVEDDKGNIWMADLDEGIILYERSTGKFSKPFEKELGASLHVPCIYFYKGSCYAVNSTTILKWDPGARVLQQFNPPPEMNKFVYDMTHDLAGNWWLATRNGLIVFNEKQNSFRRFTTADGLVTNDMDGTLYCRSNGTLIFGTPTCFTSFRPEELMGTTAHPLSLTLTGLLVNDQPVDLTNISSLTFDHRSTNFLFRWAIPDFTNPVRNQYYCMLAGIDTNWRYVGNKGETQYANLSPGTYKVLLKGSSANGNNASGIIEVRFIIRPPYWKTTGFLVLIIMAAALLFYAVVRYISQRNLKEKLLRLEKEQAVEKERNRISRDMHDDLGSGLTKIAILSEVVKKQIGEPDKAAQQLDKISVSSRELVDSLQDIIWVLNPRNDTAESLSSYIREYALKFFEGSGTEISFNYPDEFPDLHLSEEKRRNLFLSVKEALNNAAKYAQCSRVEITMHPEHGKLIINVHDNGRGFDTSNIRTFGNGLLNLQSRMEQTGGTANISSAPGHGTDVNLQMPV